MFETFDEIQQWLLYMSLVHAVRGNWGKGFHNHDQGHPAYLDGCEGNIGSNMGDSPEQNSLFQMMKELSESLRDYSGIKPEDFVFSWADFCQMAIDGYEEHK